MAVKRTKSGRWAAGNGRTYARRKDAVRAARRKRQTSAGHKARKARNRRRTKRKRR